MSYDAALVVCAGERAASAVARVLHLAANEEHEQTGAFAEELIRRREALATIGVPSIGAQGSCPPVF